jgi:DNA-binding NarL/FixJ family response regulator
MRFVLSDDDQMFRSIVESVITGQGHEVVGVAETTAGATELVRHARPDVVVIDPTLGFNTDFDVVEAAAAVGAQVIIFSFHGDQIDVTGGSVAPVLVSKPDFVALERAIAQLRFDDAIQGVESDRRRRPAREASGPIPTGLGDAQAFYEALNNAVEGDTLLSIDMPEDTSSVPGTEAIASRVAQIIRRTDRLLGSMSSVHVFLAGGDVEGTESLTTRLHDQVHPPGGSTVRSVVVAPGESSSDAFDRLKRAAAGDR